MRAGMSEQHCGACNKRGTDHCPYDCDLSYRDGCDEIAIFRRDIPIISLNRVSELCGLQCHSSPNSSAQLEHYFAGGQMTDHQSRSVNILMTPQQLTERDASICKQARKQERKRVLDDLKKFIRGNTETIEAYDGSLEDAAFCGDLFAWIERQESLRGGGAP